MQLGGYVGSFDLRDPGVYTLQIGVERYFGKNDPRVNPRPTPSLWMTAAHGHLYNECNYARGWIDGGVPLRVVLAHDGELSVYSIHSIAFISCVLVSSESIHCTRSGCRGASLTVWVSTLRHCIRLGGRPMVAFGWRAL